MRNLLSFLWAVALTASLTGCSTMTAPVMPPRGWLYTHWKSPLTTDWGTDLGTRKGKAQTQYILVPWPLSIDIAWDDAGLKKACEDGEITTLKGADYEYLNVLGLFQQFTIYAYGD